VSTSLYLYQKSLNDKLNKELERFEDIYGNILESIHETAKEALDYQERKKNNKL
jgi:hypothetical protein